MTGTNQALNFNPGVSVGDAELETETVYSRVYCTITYPADATTDDQMKLVEASGALEFWNDPAEDVYDERNNGL